MVTGRTHHVSPHGDHRPIAASPKHRDSVPGAGHTLHRKIPHPGPDQISPRAAVSRYDLDNSFRSHCRRNLTDLMSTELPATALAAWDAFLAMDRSKQRHFGYLEELEAKYERDGAGSATEKARLRELLDRHDECVRQFRRQADRLREHDIGGHRALLERIKVWNSPPPKSRASS